MKIHTVKQGSPEWIALRLGIPTASEFGNLITDKGKVRTGEAPRTYLYQKVCERWLGQPLHDFGGGAMEQGSLLEPEALPWLALQLDTDIDRVGLITTDDGRAGCSPDGFVAGRFGVEIKCPQPVNHLKWIMWDACPDEHLPQVQGGMYVAGMEHWYFMSFRRDIPPFFVREERDETYQEAIAESLEWFHKEFAVLWDRLLDMNGGRTYQEIKREREAEYAF